MLTALLARTPFLTHGSLSACNRRLNALINSTAFAKERAASGFGPERALVVVGESLVSPCSHPRDTECWLKIGRRWTPGAPLNRMRVSACSAVFEGELWLIGGEAGLEPELASCDIYNPQRNTWRTGPAMLRGRSAAVCGVVDGALVVAGGFAGMHYLDHAEAYRSATGWTALPPMPTATCQATGCVLNGRLFVVGGDSTNELQVWDGTAWSLKAACPSHIFYLAASAVHDGRMMVIGGYDHDDDEEEYDDGYETSLTLMYDPTKNSWAPGAPLPEPRTSNCAIAHAGSVYLFGENRPEWIDGPSLRLQDGEWSRLTPDIPGGAPPSPCAASLLLG